MMGTSKNRVTAVIVAVVLCGMTLKGNEYPKNYFRSPIGIPILLAGSFQELRSGHFHSGLDIKTNGKQGYRIYAAADGQIVRVGVGAGGFGNALYIRHPNGFTTVYGHLSEFSDDVQTYVRSEQYARKSFTVNLFPDAGRFPVKKGDVIALSGNSGGSSGPHLHFEIRESASEWPVNPLLFGFDLSDTRAPQIRRLKIYAMDDRSSADIRLTNGRTEVATRNRPGSLLVSGENGAYRLANVSDIKASGRIAFGIETRDEHDGSNSRLGPFSVSLSEEGKKIFEYQAEKFSFSDSRFINAHVDYAERARNKRWVQRSYLLPGNQLPSYPVTENRGISEMEPGTPTHFAYRVADLAGNTAKLAFTISGVEVNPIVEASVSERGRHVAWESPFVFGADGINANFDPNTFYEDVDFTYDVGPANEKSFSKRHTLHDAYTPVHSSFDLSIQSDIPTAWRSVAVLAYEDQEGKTSYRPAKYKEGWVSASVRALGTYYVSADTTGPRIRPINISDGKDMSRLVNIRFRISDAETGVQTFDGYVDGKWVLFSFDAKTGMMIYRFDDHVGRGNHELQVKVTDGVGNTSVYEAAFRK